MSLGRVETMDRVFLIGRILLGCFYLHGAYRHFADLEALARSAALHGVPAPHVAVLVAGALLGFGGASLLLGLFPAVGTAALILFFVPVTFVMHAFWADADPVLRQMDLVSFGRNVALLGASLMFSAIPRPWAYSVEARLHLPVRALI